jgi:hypothetical protein
MSIGPLETLGAFYGLMSVPFVFSKGQLAECGVNRTKNGILNV